MADHQVEVSPYQRIHRFADAFKGSQYAAPEADVEPHLHWRTWAVVLSCGFMLFADNYGILASKSSAPPSKSGSTLFPGGFWLGAIVAELGDSQSSIWIPEAASMWLQPAIFCLAEDESTVVVQVAAMPLVGLWADLGPQTRRYMTATFGLIAAVGLFVAGSASFVSSTSSSPF